jgi:hypothetical protein
MKIVRDEWKIWRFVQLVEWLIGSYTDGSKVTATLKR